jgi:hypothetical protein
MESFVDRKVAKTRNRQYHTAAMDTTKSSSFDTSKLVFLGILLAAVAAVAVFSSGRTTLKMAPVAPACGELAVSMPTGSYWQSPSKDEWAWQPNALVQTSVHYPSKDCTVEIRYQLSPITVEPEQYLAAAAGSWRMDIAGRGNLKIGDAVLDWAALADGDEQPSVYYGAAALGTQRMLTVRVSARPGASLLASQAFDAVIQSLKYTDTGLVQKGAEIVKQIQADGIAPLAAQFPSDVFAVKNSAGTETGFQVTRLTLPEKANEALIEAMFYHTDGKTTFNRTRFATSDMVNFIQHTWVPGSPSPLATVRVEESVLMAAVRGSPKMEFVVSDAALSEQIAELAGWKLLKLGLGEAYVDIVDSYGTVNPMRITGGKASEDPNASTSSVVFSSMLGAEFSSEIFFDPNGAVTKQIIHREDTLVIERSTAEHIKTLFPSIADEITRFQNGSTGSDTRQKEIDYGRKPI